MTTGNSADHYHMTHQQIASAMGISVTRVGQLQRAAISKLRKHPEAIRCLREIAAMPRVRSVYEETA